MDQLQEKCAVWGIYNADKLDAGAVSYKALFSMQHRGQDGSGMAGTDGENVYYHKDIGLVNDVYAGDVLGQFQNAKILIGHNRYPTSGDSNNVLNTQPLVMHGHDSFIALAHNGHLVNGRELYQNLQKQGILFHSLVDSEVLMHMIAQQQQGGSIEEHIEQMMQKVRGSYALVIMDSKSIIGVRDPWGIRPLMLGKVGESYMLASESCAFSAVGGEMIRDVLPGEILTIDENGLHSRQVERQGEGNLCIFEYVYFARADSTIQGISVFDAREQLGRLLSKTAPVEADIVAGVPDSAIPSAMGYALESGIPYGLALYKSPYAGRTFITPGQMARENAVRLKLSPIPAQVKGKRVVLVDDSIVRGTNSIQLIKMLKQAGAKEVHMRVASPPVRFPCHFGINTPSAKNLIGAHMDADALAKHIGADSLVYISNEDMKKAVQPVGCGVCTACFNGDYPMEIIE